MKRLLLSCILLTIILSGCVQKSMDISVQNSSKSNVAMTKKEEESHKQEEAKDIGGATQICQEHTFSYHVIPRALIQYVGQENFNQWLTENELGIDTYGRNSEVSISIQSFVENFEITKDVFESINKQRGNDGTASALGISVEEYYQEYGFTSSQIDSLYSSDQTFIDEAFCGPLAFVNEADGELYSIYWLAEHTPEEYVEAGLPMEEVEAVIEKAASEEFGLTELAETAQSKFALALSLESEALPVE